MEGKIDRSLESLLPYLLGDVDGSWGKATAQILLSGVSIEMVAPESNKIFSFFIPMTMDWRSLVNCDVVVMGASLLLRALEYRYKSYSGRDSRMHFE